MEHLIIDKTDDTPAIDFNPGTKELKISGRICTLIGPK